MCGIYGFSTNYPRNEKVEILKQMGKAIKHRGPDQSGLYFDDNIAIGIERLSILDLKKGHQPIFSNDGNFVIIHNGEIYNYKEIRKGLQKDGYYFKTNTDTEVIVNLFQQKGLSCLNELNGMFVFAIYDIGKQTLIIVRDRFGIKPLYYTSKYDSFIFGSELKAYRPHITLGRFKDKDRPQYEFGIFEEPLKGKAKQLDVFESEFDKGKTEYTLIKSVEF